MGLVSHALLSFLSLSACLTGVNSLSQNQTLSQDRKPTIDFKSGNGSYLLATRSSPVNLILDAADWPGVLRAAHDVAVDFGRVTGLNGTLTAFGNGTANASAIFNVTGINNDWSLGKSGNWSTPSPGKGKGTIIAGTIGNSSFIDALIKSGKLDVSRIEGKWEAYVSAVVKNPSNGTDEALVIAGKSSVLSECIGSNASQEATSVAQSTVSTMSLSKSVSRHGTGSPMCHPSPVTAFMLSGRPKCKRRPL